MTTPDPSASQPSVTPHSARPRRGKVARLPKAVRDQLNVMLLDGVPYVDFKQLLRDDPAKLIPFLNALARISDAEMRCERHRLAMEQLKAGLDPKTAPQKAPGLSPETRQRLETELNLM